MARILIIDADRDGLKSLQCALSDAGLTDVAAVPSGSFALTMIERDRPDLIVSHANIPDIDGFELCSIVRSDPALGNVLFLLLAASGDDFPDGALDGGPDRFLVGEFTDDTIVGEVQSLLSGASAVSVPAPPSPPPPPPTANPRPAADSEPAGVLRGSLAAMDLPGLAQAIGPASQTGQLSVSPSARAG